MSAPTLAEAAHAADTAARDMLRDDYLRYVAAMLAAGYATYMTFEGWLAYSGPNVPPSMSWAHASTRIASEFGPSAQALAAVPVDAAIKAREARRG